MQVLIPAPFWVSYPEMAKLAGATPVIVDCPADDGFLLTPAALKASLKPASRLLILCSPSNPTGSVYSRYVIRLNYELKPLTYSQHGSCNLKSILLDI